LEKKWLEGSTGLKNDPQGRQVFPLAGNPLGKFLATLLDPSCDLAEISTFYYNFTHFSDKLEVSSFDGKFSPYQGLNESTLPKKFQTFWLAGKCGLGAPIICSAFLGAGCQHLSPCFLD
jgi:hypothetical protein